MTDIDDKKLPKYSERLRSIDYMIKRAEEHKAKMVRINGRYASVTNHAYEELSTLKWAAEELRAKRDLARLLGFHLRPIAPDGTQELIRVRPSPPPIVIDPDVAARNLEASPW